MASTEDFERRLEELEKAKKGRASFFLQYLISPVLLLVIGFLLNSQVERAKRNFQQLEVQVKQIEAAQEMLKELFSDVPERAFIADRLMAQLVDEQLSKEISGIVSRYYSEKLSGHQMNSDAVQDAQRIAEAARSVGGPAAEQIITQLREKRYFIVVLSLSEAKFEPAISRAQELVRLGYKAEVHRTSTGYLAVTLGRFPLDTAREIRDKAVEDKEVTEDAYLTPGDTFVAQVYPQSGEPSAGANG